MKCFFSKCSFVCDFNLNMLCLGRPPDFFLHLTCGGVSVPLEGYPTKYFARIHFFVSFRYNHQVSKYLFFETIKKKTVQE